MGSYKCYRGLIACALLMLAGSWQAAQAQFVNRWLSAGSLHNWYSEVGNECEECGPVVTQQAGMRWPGIYRFTDMQAAKALWIGARDVTDENGTQFPFRVVHVGPRVRGSGEFFPVTFEVVSRFDLPEVNVDGEISLPEAEMTVDRVDPSIAPTVMINNEVNTLLGITMERKIMQFSQDYHDNYHVIEYTFTNTGNTDGDPDIELPNQTLEGVYFFWQWRWSVAKETRYIIGNATGWGINTMLDTRGDGVEEDPPDEQFRAQFAWHGYYPSKAVSYNNLGGPILPEALPDAGGQVASSDTLGRLGASQFVGAVTLHADASASDETDDPGQPSTTSWLGSDESFQSNNDAFSPGQMAQEYGLMSAGHQSPRHAKVVEPTGLPGYIDPTGDPSLGTPGGFSNANGYGPYTLGPGESVRIVVAEAAAGLSRDANIKIGRAYKASGADDDATITLTVNGQSHSLTKNEWVLTSRDSLFQTFRRALANYDSGYDIPRPPAPPSVFNVNSGGDRIALSWDVFADQPPPDRFEIYRARDRFDSTYTLIHTAGSAERSFDDTTPIRGIDYYYYIVAVSDGSQNDGTGLTPAGVPLESSRYFTQTYTPARLRRPAGEAMADIRVVPNPFNISSSQDLRFGGGGTVHRLGFLNIPGRAQVDIFTETGELVDQIIHEDGSGDAFWDHTTSSGQVVASGLYIAIITNLDTGEKAFRKFVIIR